MALLTKHMKRSFTLLALTALLALYPPGPTRTLAQSDPPPPLPFHLFLPLGGNMAPAPDLIFTPDNVELTPGTEASISVRVEPQADLTGASFELPGVQDGVTSRFEAAPDGQSGTFTIEANTAAEATEHALMVQGTSGDGTKGWVGKLNVTTKPSINAATLFVEPLKGNDTNPGTQAAPFKTLTKALSVAKAGDTVKLGGGGYGSIGSAGNGEVFPTSGLVVPSGVTIEGTVENGFPVATLLGTGNNSVGLNFAGDATVRNLFVGGPGFGVGMFAKQGKQTFSNIFLASGPGGAIIDGLVFGGGIVLSGTAQATLQAGSSGANTTGSTIFVNSGRGVDLSQQARLTMSSGAITTDGGVGVQVRDQAPFTMSAGRIEGPKNNCDTSSTLSGLLLLGMAQATLKNGARLVDIRGKAIVMKDNTKATLIGATVTRTNPACTGAIGIDMVFGNIDTVFGNTVSLSLTNTTVSGFAQAGINLDGFHILSVKGGSITNNGIGINAVFAKAANAGRPIPEITGVSLTANQIGINSQSVPIKLRKSNVTGNGIGINIKERNDQLFFLRPDLGTAADPGGNIITGNTTTGVMFDHSGGTFTADMFASGNTWNPNTQAAGSSGQYTVGFAVRSDRSDALARGKNFFLVKAANGNTTSTEIKF